MATKKPISYIICKKTQLNNYQILPHKIGQLIFVKDSHEIWFDWQENDGTPTRELYGKDGEYISGLIIIESEALFDKESAILSAYYYFKDTNNFYYFNHKAEIEEDKWILLNNTNNVIEFGTSDLSSMFEQKLFVDYENETIYLKKKDTDETVIIGSPIWIDIDNISSEISNNVSSEILSNF